MAIEGLGNLTAAELEQEVANGGRFVVFQYTISILLMTFKRGSAVFYFKPGEGSMGKGMPYTLLTLLLGWWGFPWGPIYSVMSIATNLGGGKDVTNDVMENIRAARSGAGSPA